MKFNIFFRPVAVLALTAVFVSAGCSFGRQNTSGQAPELSHPDWKVLRNAVTEYEKTVAAPNHNKVLVVQENFRALVSRHSSDRIGDEALYYVGRIYYDIHDYHDAREMFMAHKEWYPESEFAPTIVELEAVMDDQHTEYTEWLQRSKGVVTE